MQPLPNCKELLTCCLPPRGAPQSWGALQKRRYSHSFTGYHPVINQNIGGGLLSWEKSSNYCWGIYQQIMWLPEGISQLMGLTATVVAIEIICVDLRRMIGFSRICGDHTGSKWNGIDPRSVPKNADSWVILLAPRNASNMSSISWCTAAVKKHFAV